MRLNEHQIDVVSFEIVRALEEQELVSGPEERLARSVAHAITEDLRVEEALDASSTARCSSASSARWPRNGS
jgi:hypothetical protein